MKLLLLRDQVPTRLSNIAPQENQHAIYLTEEASSGSGLASMIKQTDEVQKKSILLNNIQTAFEAIQ